MFFMLIFEFLRQYGDIVDQGTSPAERLRSEKKDFSAEIALMFILVANFVIFGMPVLGLWFIARNLNFI